MQNSIEVSLATCVIYSKVLQKDLTNLSTTVINNIAVSYTFILVIIEDDDEKFDERCTAQLKVNHSLFSLNPFI